MEVPFVDLKAQYSSLKSKIEVAIADVINNTSFIGGSKVEEFEERFASFVGVNHVVSCANGTDAIEIALEALGIGPGDEVLVPAYSWVSTASAVSRVGAEPVFVDVHPEYYTIDPKLAAEAINNKTKAIIPVHFYGLPADMPAIMKLAQKHKIFVVEDCAQAHGAMIGKEMAGTFGDIATFSFYPGKNLGAYGDGGAIVTNNESLAEACRVIGRLGQKGKHNHVQAGRNSRLDALQAAILLAKLPLLEEWTARRRWVARQYNQQLDELDLQVQRIPSDFKHVYHLYVIQTDGRDKLMEFLKENNIQTQIHYPKPLNQFKFFSHSGPCEIADAMADRLLSLPLYAEMNQEQIDYVVSVIRKFTYMR
jgi:dTDP-4-amino-4,6-dideoxygalactose transaminase